MLARGFLLTMMLLAAGPSVAQPLMEGLPAPNELAPFPNCTATDGNGKPSMQPYAFDPEVYGGIYLAVEQRFAPLARYFFPVLQVEDNKYWVRITRTTRGGVRPPDRLTVGGVNHNLLGEAGVVPAVMKIDKCNGAILEMSFDKNKLILGGTAAANRPAAPASKPVAINKPVVGNQLASNPAASKPVAVMPPVSKLPVSKPPSQVASNPAASKPVAITPPVSKLPVSKPPNQVASNPVASKPMAITPTSSKPPISNSSVNSPPASNPPASSQVASSPAASKPVAGSPPAAKLADALIHMFGRDAEGQARENAASNARVGDSEGEKLWLAVADIVSDRVYGKGHTDPTVKQP